MSRYAWLRSERFLWAVAAAMFLAAGYTVYTVYRAAQHTMYRVTTRWDGDTLRVSTMQGGVVVTHLAGRSQDQTVFTRLLEPGFIEDSEGLSFDRGALEKLRWSGPGGRRLTPPPVGSRIDVFYYRLQRSEWRDSVRQQP